jgi:hypothetical protein
MKTREELAEELHIRCKLDEERIKSDELYAIKRIETIVYSAIALITAGFIYSLLRVIWK